MSNVRVKIFKKDNDVKEYIGTDCTMWADYMEVVYDLDENKKADEPAEGLFMIPLTWDRIESIQICLSQKEAEWKYHANVTVSFNCPHTPDITILAASITFGNTYIAVTKDLGDEGAIVYVYPVCLVKDVMCRDKRIFGASQHVWY